MTLTVTFPEWFGWVIAAWAVVYAAGTAVTWRLKYWTKRSTEAHEKYNALTGATRGEALK